MTMPARATRSLCPVCLRQISAAIVNRDKNYFLEKSCPEHGHFSTVIWRGEQPSLPEWEGGWQDERGTDAAATEYPDCPGACGLCARHLRQTCCALVEVTARCNLTCPFCFARSLPGETAALAAVQSKSEPSLTELATIFRQLAAAGRTFVQLSGGEPTLREDLPDIVTAARQAGCVTVQLNSNGLRLGSEPGYAARLAAAGLSFVFMQFDGTRDAIYTRLRGQPLLAAKEAAIAACAAARLGVALAPTIVPGVNDDNIGAILRFALRRAPAVRGVHFQPVSYLGRYPEAPADANRITIPEILRALAADGMVRISDFVPSACDHPRCGFHGDFLVRPDGSLEKLTGAGSAAKSGDTQRDTGAHIKNRNFVARRWRRVADAAVDATDTTDATEVAIESACCGGADASRSGDDCNCLDMDTFLRRVKSHGFTITGMAFQDAWTIDLARLRRCSLHVYATGRIIPFCARYLSSQDISRLPRREGGNT